MTDTDNNTTVPTESELSIGSSAPLEGSETRSIRAEPQLKTEASPEHSSPSITNPIDQSPSPDPAADTEQPHLSEPTPDTPVPEAEVLKPPIDNETHVGEISDLVSPILEEAGVPPATDTPPPPIEPPDKPMDIPDSSTSKNTQSKTLLWLIIPLIALALGLFILSVIYPDIIGILIRAGATLVSVIFLVFIILGVFIIFGLREEAAALMSLIFEGGVKYIDIAEQISKLWERFLEIVKEMILTISPIIAIFFAAMFYYLIVFSFRVVGVDSDLTVFTIILTIALASLTAFLSQMNVGSSSDDDSFKAQFGKRFGRVFVDGVEIAVLAIFLTMDMERLFFLPENLHGTIRAEAFDINFMERGFRSHAVTAAIRFAGAAVFVEIIRKIHRVVAATRKHYQLLKREIERRGIAIVTLQQSFEIIRHAARRAFRESIDDFTKFLGFTTVLIFAFFFFPVLKMLSLLVFNLTNLVWDILVPKRLSGKSSSEDLFSRILIKVLRLENPSTNSEST